MRTLWAGLIVLALLATGCSGLQVQTYSKPVTPEPVYTGIKRVAVLPFDSLAEGAVGPKHAELMLVQELLSKGIFESIEEPRYVAGLMKKLKLRNTESLDREIVRKIGEELQVDAVLCGGLMLNGEEEKSTSVEFSMFLDMLVVETGDLVWSSRAFIHSNTTVAEVFGLSEGPSVNELAQRGVIQLSDELAVHLTDNRELELEQIFEQQKEETKMATEEAKDIEAEKTQEADEGNAEEILLKVKPK
ncbi:hypothetical protein EPN96_07780 [bacterium]|nr:MAG: hypothetical protein EPN96_07780 [bacterium]